MTEYESAVRHMTPAGRVLILCSFLLWMGATVGAGLLFGYEVWLTRLLCYGAVLFGLLLLCALLDARWEAAERHRQYTSGKVHIWLRDAPYWTSR